MKGMHAVIETLLTLGCSAGVAFLALLLVAFVVYRIVVYQRGVVLARGILLRVAPLPLRTGGVGVSRFQVRSVQIDVEIDGRPPFEVSTLLEIPSRFVNDVLPGATVAIRLNPDYPATMKVLGPGMAVPAFALPTAVAPRSPK